MSKRMIVSVVLAVALLGVGAPAWAWWTDTASGTASVSAGALQPPTNMTCSGGGLLTSPNLAWTAPTTGLTPNQYTVTVRNGSATASPTVYTTTSTSWQLPTNLLSLFANFYISVQSSLAGTSWTSASANPGQIVNITSVVFVGAVSSCSGTFTPTS